jgi:UTP--glucose-1-phosphate uridylyltransferase
MSNTKITKVIMPVAGFGTRFLPATKSQPKEMLAIVDKPVIHFLVEEAVNSGVKDIIFVTGRGKRAIEDYFDYALELEQVLSIRGKRDLISSIRQVSELGRFTYVRQKEARGNGDAILAAEHLIHRGESCAVLFGDDVVDSEIPALKQMISVFEKYGDPVVALEEVPHNKTNLYGIVSGKEVEKNIFQIDSMVEKPSVKNAPSNLAVVGKYIINYEILSILKRLRQNFSESRELGITDALKIYLKNKPVYGIKFVGKRFDCGSKIGLLEATVHFALKHKEVGQEFKVFLKKIVQKMALK